MSLQRALFIFIFIFSSRAFTQDAPATNTNSKKRLGIGYSEENFTYRRFNRSPNGPQARFIFHCAELNGAIRRGGGGIFGIPSYTSLEAQLHHCRDIYASNVGSLQLNEAVVNGLWNLRLWQGFGIEGGVGFNYLITPDNLNQLGVGYVAGVTYTFKDKFELRFRKEEKSLLHIGSSRCDVYGFSTSISMYF